MSFEFKDTKNVKLPEDFNRRFQTFLSIESQESNDLDADLNALNQTIASYPDDVAEGLNEPTLQNQLLGVDNDVTVNKKDNSKSHEPVIIDLGKLLSGDNTELSKLFNAKEDNNENEDESDDSVSSLLVGKYIIPLPGLAYLTPKNNSYDYVLLYTGNNNKTGVVPFDIKKEIDTDILFDKNTLKSVPKKYRKYAMDASQFIENQEVKLDKLIAKKNNDNQDKTNYLDEIDDETKEALDTVNSFLGGLVTKSDKKLDKSKLGVSLADLLKDANVKNNFDNIKQHTADVVKKSAGKAKVFNDNTVQPTVDNLLDFAAKKLNKLKQDRELREAIKKTDNNNNK